MVNSQYCMFLACMLEFFFCTFIKLSIDLKYYHQTLPSHSLPYIYFLWSLKCLSACLSAANIFSLFLMLVKNEGELAYKYKNCCLLWSLPFFKCFYTRLLFVLYMLIFMNIYIWKYHSMTSVMPENFISRRSKQKLCCHCSFSLPLPSNPFPNM